LTGGVLAAAKRAGLFAFARYATARSLRILCYHGLWTLPGEPFGNTLFMPVDQFRARMRWLAASDYPVLDLDEAVKLLAADQLPERAVVVTIDDGWRSTHSLMLPILEELGLPATLYMSTWYADQELPVLNVALACMIGRCDRSTLDLAGIAPGLEGEATIGDGAARRDLAARIFAAIDALPAAERPPAYATVAARAGIDPAGYLDQFRYMNSGEIADAHRRGLRFELHTHRHRSVTRHLAEIGQEIDDNRHALHRKGAGENFEHFCYPGGYYQAGVEPILAERGIVSATLTIRGLNPPGTHPLRLRRLLDGPGVSQIAFEAWLAGLFEPIDRRRA
jgi:peptidoglycan/xylan/chitin deacetylase (PgdA/CDA1 family)